MGKVIEMKPRKAGSGFLIEASDGSIWNPRQLMYAARMEPRSYRRQLIALRSLLLATKPKALVLQFPRMPIPVM
jgi:hypothetical protein